MNKNDDDDMVIGIKLDEKDLNLVTQQLEDVLNKVKQLNDEFEKLQSNEFFKKRKSMNNDIIINTSFMGNEHDKEKIIKLLSEYASEQL